jgi:hypothetical protein
LIDGYSVRIECQENARFAKAQIGDGRQVSDRWQMNFKFGSWNVNNRRPSNAQVVFLRSHDFDISALQEVSSEFQSAPANSGLLKRWACPL